MTEKPLPPSVRALLDRMKESPPPEDFVLMVRLGGRDSDGLHFVFDGCIHHHALMMAAAQKHFSKMYGPKEWLLAMIAASLQNADGEHQAVEMSVEKKPDEKLH